MGKCVEKLNRLTSSIKNRQLTSEYHENNQPTIVGTAKLPSQKTSRRDWNGYPVRYPRVKAGQVYVYNFFSQNNPAYSNFHLKSRAFGQQWLLPYKLYRSRSQISTRVDCF